MLGHYLVTLCEQAEDAILTGNMAPVDYNNGTTRCLVGWAADVNEDYDSGRPQHDTAPWDSGDINTTVEGRYDSICRRFGMERVNAAIRNRILSNRARRTLTAGCPLVRHEPQGLTRINQ